MDKTNVMRMLDKKKIPYKIMEYTYDEADLSGVSAAHKTGMPPEKVFKTLVAKGDKTGILVFCIPVDKELDLKKAAVLSKNKKVEMIHVKELLALTGYIRGGCSPIGMKKSYPVFLDQRAFLQEEIGISAGVRGKQVLLSPQALADFIRAQKGDLLKEENEKKEEGTI